jgi:hypothetical protein
MLFAEPLPFPKRGYQQGGQERPANQTNRTYMGRQPNVAIQQNPRKSQDHGVKRTSEFSCDMTNSTTGKQIEHYAGIHFSSDPEFSSFGLDRADPTQFTAKPRASLATVSFIANTTINA